MPEWTGHLRRRLARLQLSPAREAEVIEELSQHLEQRYEELRSSGTSDAEARRLAIEERLEPDALADRMRWLRHSSGDPTGRARQQAARLRVGGDPDAGAGHRRPHGDLQRGRHVPAATDASRSGDAVVVISDGFWTRALARDPSVLGRTLQLNDRRYAVIGIMQTGADFGVFQILKAADYSRSLADRGARAAVDHGRARALGDHAEGAAVVTPAGCHRRTVKSSWASSAEPRGGCRSMRWPTLSARSSS
jgi:hypothetical protein